MNGARALLATLQACGVDTLFANPGTSEMHLVAALDDTPEVRAVLCLFEGVATGAADGFGRMARRPAAALLHLGPGLGNGLANLHNARRARTPVLAVVGDHATGHLRYDAPLTSDIVSVARTVSGWWRTSADPAALGPDTAEAVAAAAGGQVATLIVPADVSWSDGASVAAPAPVRPRGVDPEAVAAAGGQLRAAAAGEGLILLGGDACTAQGLQAAARVAAGTGCRLLVETFPARLTRGAGLPRVDRLAYLAEFAESQLRGVRTLVLAGAASPVSFFAYPGRRSDLVPDGASVTVLASPGGAAQDALTALADEVGAPAPAPESGARPALPEGELTAQAVCDVVGALLPEGAIISDEAQTSGLWLPGATAAAPPHDVLTLTGGAIGQGLPVAVGAALACPDRPVLALQADGSAFYTVQALWTMAREGLDVTVVVLTNRSYAILGMELSRVGAVGGGAAARSLLDLSRPDLDMVAISRGMGVPARRAQTVAELVEALRAALAEPGPHLIDAIVPSVV